jgi:hypothetical protein
MNEIVVVSVFIEVILLTSRGVLWLHVGAADLSEFW